MTAGLLFASIAFADGGQRTQASSRQLTEPARVTRAGATITHGSLQAATANGQRVFVPIKPGQCTVVGGDSGAPVVKSLDRCFAELQKTR